MKNKESQIKEKQRIRDHDKLWNNIFQMEIVDENRKIARNPCERGFVEKFKIVLFV